MSALSQSCNLQYVGNNDVLTRFDDAISQNTMTWNFTWFCATASWSYYANWYICYKSGFFSFKRKEWILYWAGNLSNCSSFLISSLFIRLHEAERKRDKDKNRRDLQVGFWAQTRTTAVDDSTSANVILIPVARSARGHAQLEAACNPDTRHDYISRMLM